MAGPLYRPQRSPAGPTELWELLPWRLRDVFFFLTDRWWQQLRTTPNQLLICNHYLVGNFETCFARLLITKHQPNKKTYKQARSLWPTYSPIGQPIHLLANLFTYWPTYSPVNPSRICYQKILKSHILRCFWAGEHLKLMVQNINLPDKKSQLQVVFHCT